MEGLYWGYIGLPLRVPPRTLRAFVSIGEKTSLEGPLSQEAVAT